MPVLFSFSSLQVDRSLVEGTSLTPLIVQSFTLFVSTFRLNYLANIRQLDLWSECKLTRWSRLNSRLIDGVTGVAEKWKTGYRDRS